MVGRADQLLNFIAVAVEVLWQHVSANRKTWRIRLSWNACFFPRHWLSTFYNITKQKNLVSACWQMHKNIYLMNTGAFMSYGKHGRCFQPQNAASSFSSWKLLQTEAQETTVMMVLIFLHFLMMTDLRWSVGHPKLNSDWNVKINLICHNNFCFGPRKSLTFI